MKDDIIHIVAIRVISLELELQLIQLTRATVMAGTHVHKKIVSSRL